MQKEQDDQFESKPECSAFPNTRCSCRWQYQLCRRPKEDLKLITGLCPVQKVKVMDSSGTLRKWTQSQGPFQFRNWRLPRPIFDTVDDAKVQWILIWMPASIKCSKCMLITLRMDGDWCSLLKMPIFTRAETDKHFSKSWKDIGNKNHSMPKAL